MAIFLCNPKSNDRFCAEPTNCKRHGAFAEGGVGMEDSATVPRHNHLSIRIAHMSVRLCCCYNNTRVEIV